MSNPVRYLIHPVSHGRGEVVLSYFTLQSRSFHLDRGCILGGMGRRETGVPGEKHQQMN